MYNSTRLLLIAIVVVDQLMLNLVVSTNNKVSREKLLDYLRLNLLGCTHHHICVHVIGTLVIFIDLGLINVHPLIF